MRLVLAAGLGLAVLGAAALAASNVSEAESLPVLGDPHLATIPLTAAEIDRVAKVLAPHAADRPLPPPLAFEALPGGAATAKPRALNRQAFSHPSGNMSFDRRAEFFVGNGFFQKLWVTAPSSTKSSDGLGPFYNARSCQRCHLMDGRGHPPSGARGDDAVSMLLQIGKPGGDPIAEIPDYIAMVGDPVYGHQLQDFAAPGLPPEGRVALDFEDVPVALSGGESVTLRRPVFSVGDLAYGPLDPESRISARIAPPMIGVGLLEAIPATRILSLADPDDADGDGISGRANVVWSGEFDQPMLGRFGWKAGQPTVAAQSATAFSNDLGISTPLLPDPWGDCTQAEQVCRTAPMGAEPGAAEIEAEAFDTVVFYSRNLAVPGRRDADDPTVIRGREVFQAAGCASCHTPAHVTHRLENQPEQSFQLIWPYTDMLLHDMGPDLDDGKPEARAAGAEWRTPPLWGIGLTETVSGEVALLHDGRARDVLEAVLWHGGEGQAARDRVVAMSPEDRAALVAFVESL